MSDQKPVGWTVRDADGRLQILDYTTNSAEVAQAWAGLSIIRDSGKGVVPLYTAPQFALTDAEREAVEWGRDIAGVSDVNAHRLAALSGLLARLGGGA